jgi:hypothetical protein
MSDAAHFDKKALLDVEIRPLLDRLTELCTLHGIPYACFLQVGCDSEGQEFFQTSKLSGADERIPAGLSVRLLAAHALMHPECDSPVAVAYLADMDITLQRLLADHAKAPEPSHNEKLVAEILGRILQ